MLADAYNGISTLYTSEYKASGSKFYGYLFPVKSASDFDERIKEYKEKFADATHVCSGCVIGTEREYQRCSDDGEPSNSSGRPILNAILSAKITYVGCAVVRYYGGKKLGIPGLIESYGAAAQLCIDDAEMKDLVLTDNIICAMHPTEAYRLYNFLARQKGVTYTTNADGQFEVTCSKSMTTDLRSELKKILTLVVL
ncbi:MAG: YigZ family protein [Bacteroidia bacterium]|jgi:putative IMPACT (imprinted ancient) family translation regulator|nr:YigZ family protein [Bacteroidia bacterium]